MQQTYVQSTTVYFLITTLYFFNYFLLAFYLMIIPIQIAFNGVLLSNQENLILLQTLNVFVLILYGFHILLYCDQYIRKQSKKQTRKTKEITPYQKFTSFVGLQITYDCLCLIFALELVIVNRQSLIERVFQVLFFFKVYKLELFKQKCMYTVIGTNFYTAFRISKALLTVFVAVSFIGSIFYGVQYLLLLNSDPLQVSLLWIVTTPAINELVQQSFWIQLQYTMYWALSTASTAAYGDISAVDPVGTFFNILALLFEGFLFGYYMNIMHSIPLQIKESQVQLLQKFNSFNKHSTTQSLSNEVYLKILCSIQYQHQKKVNRQQLESSIPNYYLEEVKYRKYKKFLNYSLNNIIFKKELSFRIAKEVTQIVCQKGQNLYQYQDAGVSPYRDDLFYLDQGQVTYSIGSWSESHFSSNTQISQMTNFGYYGFMTGLKMPVKAFCQNYSVVLLLSRKKFKQCLISMSQKILFMEKQFQTIGLDIYLLINNQPIIKYYGFYQENKNSSQIDSQKKSQVQEMQVKRGDIKKQITRNSINNLSLFFQERDSYFKRSTPKSKKIILKKIRNRNVGIQTNFKDLRKQICLQVGLQSDINIKIDI